MILLALLMGMQDAPAPDLHDTTREPLSGGFAIEHERYQRRGIPIMHAPDGWQKVRLVWISPDGHVRPVIEDDGYSLNLTGQVVAADPARPCLSSGIPTRYAWLAGGRGGWKRLMRDYRSIMAGCGPTYVAAIAQAAPDMGRADADFAAAAAQFRRRAADAFGSIDRRCEAFAGPPEPFMSPRCTRWSARPSPRP